MHPGTTAALCSVGFACTVVEHEGPMHYAHTGTMLSYCVTYWHRPMITTKGDECEGCEVLTTA